MSPEITLLFGLRNNHKTLSKRLDNLWNTQSSCRYSCHLSSGLIKIFINAKTISITDDKKNVKPPKLFKFVSICIDGSLIPLIK